jgi:hypothetical protein
MKRSMQAKQLACRENLLAVTLPATSPELCHRAARHLCNAREGHKQSLRQQEIAPPNSVDTNITPDDLRAGYKAWRETTATSPSGQHLGYYKAIAAFERTPEDGDSPRRL